MDCIITNEALAREEIRKMDKITGLNGASLAVRLHDRGRSVGKFCRRSDGVVFFSFHTKYFGDPTIPFEVLRDVVRHEYAHYMDYLDRGTSGHGKLWKQCCLIVGAKPVEYYDPADAERINRKRELESRLNALLDGYRAGMSIDHPRFGMGRIEKIRGEALNRIAEVRFGETVRQLGLDWVAFKCGKAETKTCA